MARHPRFTFKKTTDGWKVEVPSTLSPTGKRQRFFYPTRDKAKDAAADLKKKHEEHGAKASPLSPGDTEDALQALKTLRGFNITLRQAALDWRQQHDDRAKSLTLRQAWERAETAREELSDRYKKDFGDWKRWLPDSLLDTPCSDIRPEDITKALTKITTGPTMWRVGARMLSVVFGDEVRGERLKANPCKRLDPPKKRKTDEVRILTVDELKALLAACVDYPDGLYRECSACRIPFAILAFAGLRPAEVERLGWEDIDLAQNNIRLSGSKTKTGRLRNVRIQPSLRAWLETWPEQNRKGPVCPGTWTRKAWRVRKAAGLDGREAQDVLRHSFGSYLLAYEGDRAALESDMGHQHVDTFFRHYHQHVIKKEAIKWWQVLPPGEKLGIIGAAPSPNPSSRRTDESAG